MVLSRLVTFYLILTASVFAFAENRITVAAAANLSAVAPELAKAFHSSYPQDEAVFTFGSSGSLVTQITYGAPFDVFLSADMSFANKLFQAGLTQKEAEPYAVGKLVLFTAKHLDLADGLRVVTSVQVRQVVNCNPELAPYGLAAKQALERSNLWDEVQSKLVSAQNITQAVQFTLTGADIGFINLSAVFTPALAGFKEGKDWILIDQTLYDPIRQGYVVLKGSQNKQAVIDFDAFLHSSAAHAVFARYGYGTP